MLIRTSRKNIMRPVIIALDYFDDEQILKLIRILPPKYCKLKIGYITFMKKGTVIISLLKKFGFDIFLDLKLCDIPSVIFETISYISKLGIWMITIHATGGISMIKSAKEAIVKNGDKILLVAVTTLTSIDQEDLKKLGINKNILKFTLKLTDIAYKNGADGVVCSALESKYIKLKYGSKILVVTPGIRLDNKKSYDQKRIADINIAYNNGSDYIVIGRTITKNKNINQIIDSILKIIQISSSS